MQNTNQCTPELFYKLIMAGLIVFVCITACQPLGTGLSPDESAYPEFMESFPVERENSTQSIFSERNIDNPVSFAKLSVEEGLSQSTVTCITQDSKGFIWIGTENGLNRYDGYQFRIYKHDPEDDLSISNNFIYDIYEDETGFLWIATEMGLNRLDPATGLFERFLHEAGDETSLSHNRVSSVIQSKHGDIWVGTYGGGLNHLNIQEGQFTHYKSVAESASGITDNYIEDIYEDHRGNIWIATRNGLNRLDPDNHTVRKFINIQGDGNSLPANHITRMIGGEPGVIWMGTADGLLIMMVRERFYTYPVDPFSTLSTRENHIRDLYLDPSGVILVVSQRAGLSAFSPKTAKFHHFPRSVEGNQHAISSMIIKAIFRDHSGVYWVGTEAGGINVFDQTSQRFTLYSHKEENLDSITSNVVFSIFEDSEGLLWIGTSRGLDCLDQETGTYRHYQHNPRYPFRTLKGYQVSDIQEDQRGKLWVGTDHGLNYYDSRTNLFIPASMTVTTETFSTRELNDQFITSIYMDSKGILWIGAIGLGLIRFDPQTEQAIVYEVGPDNAGGLRGDVIMSIVEDKANTIWVGMLNEGLARIDDRTGEVIHFTQENSQLSDDNVLSIHIDQDDHIWVGTLGGLNLFDPEILKFSAYREHDGLVNDAVFGILEDGQGFLWLSTSRGISRFDRDNEVFRNFDQFDELGNIEFNSGAYYQNDKGEMFFGGVDGLNRFFPEQIIENDFIPPVRLTALTQGGQPINSESEIPFLREIQLEWPQNYFEFEFTSLSFIHPEQNQYAYFLEGFDKEWNYNGSNRYGKYTNLPGGDYILHIAASNNDGLWNKEGTKVIITVIPPFWDTTWFRILIAAGLILALFAGYRYRVHTMQVSNRRLAAQVQERTREMAQRKQIAEGLREILILINSNKPLQESLDFIIQQAEELVEASWLCMFRLAGDEVLLMASSLNEEERAAFCFVEEKSPDVLITLLNHYAAMIRENELVHLEQLESIKNNLDIELHAQVDQLQFLLLPLNVDGDIYGGMAVLLSDDDRLTQEKMDLLIALVEQASLALGNDVLRDKAQELAVLSERNRLARDLHDAVTQTLFSASLIAEALPDLWLMDADEGKQLLAELRLMNRSALAEMRTLLLELRPTAIIETHLKDLIKQLAETIIGKTKMAVDLDIGATYNLPDDVHLCFYRVAQEALNNIVKHAEAGHIKIEIDGEPISETENDNLRIRYHLLISDDGCGFVLNGNGQGGFGIQNIRERAQAIGALLNISSTVNEGTRLQIVWEGEVDIHDGNE